MIAAAIRDYFITVTFVMIVAGTFYWLIVGMMSK